MVDRDFDKYIAEIYRDMEIQIIQSMKRNLARHTLEEDEYGFNYPQWQAMKIKELRRYQRENGRILQGVSNKIPKDVSKHIKEELTQGRLDEMKKYREAMADGYKSAVAMKDSFFKINERKVNSLIKAVKNDLKTANTAALRMTNDVYREVIFKAGMFSANGVMTSKQAIDMATKDFLTRGINCIEYKDGRRVNIADYTSMAVRTANQRAYMIGEGEFRKKLGETLVIISQHNTSCEKCKPFERKVLIDDVYSGGTAEDGDYMLLSQAMAAGLFHPRCRHGLGTYYPELEDINGYETTDNRLNEYDDEELNRAHIENMVQRYRRLTFGSLDPYNIAKYQERLNEWEKRLNGFENNKVNAKNEQISVESVKNPDALFERIPKHNYDKNINSDNVFLHNENVGEKAGSELFAEQEQKNLYQSERIISGNKYETAIVYDETGKVIFKRKGSYSAVSFTKAQLPKLKGKIITHNHPSCSGLSADDIIFMQKNSLAEIRSCNMFGTHIMRPTEKSLTVSFDMLDKKLTKLYNEIGNRYRDIAAQNGKSILYYLQDVEIDTMKAVSKEYNFYYKWEPIK